MRKEVGDDILHKKRKYFERHGNDLGQVPSKVNPADRQLVLTGGNCP
jgi:hypothetical protein